MQDMSDLFADVVPSEFILKVWEFEREHPDTKFLNLTKNPKRYIEFIDVIPPNAYLGTTIETDLNTEKISQAPSTFNRFYYTVLLSQVKQFKERLFLSIEPILKFTRAFETMIYWIKPWAVAVGYDNYNHKLAEPTLSDTMRLVEKLKLYTTVYSKTLRKAWFE